MRVPKHLNHKKLYVPADGCALGLHLPKGLFSESRTHISESGQVTSKQNSNDKSI